MKMRAKFIFPVLIMCGFVLSAQDEKSEKSKFCKEDIDKKAMSLY
jgi:hypothetical protein